MSISVGTRLGPYEVTVLIGTGGMGEVYRAHDTKLGRDVALKVLPATLATDAEYMARFQREAHVLASLNHPHIASIFGLEESGNTRALVMELVEGPTLADRIREGTLPLAEALELARQIAEALEYAHKVGIIHRDLKPANVKLTAQGSVKLLDFGLAKAAERFGNSAPLEDADTLPASFSQPGGIVGTPAYMSPEQARGEPVDSGADIWAFGVVLLEMLTGKGTFRATSTSETLAAVLTKDPEWGDLPSQTPPSIRRLLKRCLERDRKKRLQAIGEARIAIEDYPADSITTVPPAQRRMLPSVAAGVFAIAATAFALLHFRESPGLGHQVKYLMGPPEGTHHLLHFAPSPDGRLIAFVGETNSGHKSLWVQKLDSITAQPLPGTDGALLPFWSPDNRYVGFFDVVSDSLKTIDVRTLSRPSPPKTLCEGVGLGRATWNRDGVIVFGAGPGGSLHRVSAAGGDCQTLTNLDPSKRERTHFWPWFLPDGRHFLFTVVSDTRENSGIYVGTLDSPERKRVLEDLSNAVYVTAPEQGGLLLFARGGTLMAQRFDAAKLRLAGDPFTVAEHVRYDVFWAEGAYAVSENGVLVFLGTDTRSQLTWLDRGGKRLGTVGEVGLAGSFDLSPDEKQVAVSRLDPATGTSDIWRIEMARGVLSRITFDPFDDRGPLWSPDGKRVVFSSNRAGAYDLYEKDASGSGRDELLVKSGGGKWADSWSPDGRFLLYEEEQLQPTWRSSLWLLPHFGDKKPVPMGETPFPEDNAVFSPDGRWVAYESTESGGSEIYVRGTIETLSKQPSGIPVRSQAKWQISSGGGERPKWRRDGRELLYHSSGVLLCKIMAVEIGKGPSFEPGVPRVLFETPMSLNAYGNFAVSVDGQRFLIASPVEKWPPVTVVLNWTKGLNP